jgi:hypothetical protein
MSRILSASTLLSEKKLMSNTIKGRFGSLSLRLRVLAVVTACVVAAMIVATVGGSAANPSLQPQTGALAPRFQTYLSPAGTADSFGEPSIGANWLTGKIMAYGGFGNPVRVEFDECSSPAKANWVTTPTITTATFRALGDPILFTDRETGRTLVSQLEGGTKQSTTDYTEDDGASFHPTQGSGINSGVDHQTLGGGPFAPGAPSHSYPNAIYYCAQDVADANCALSLDGGVTFGPAVPIYNVTQCTGLHGHVKVAPDGTVYVPNRGCGGNPVGTPVTARQYQGIAKSTDNGITWTVKPVTGSKPNSNDPSLGIGADGTLYFAYADNDNHPKVKVSHDKGETWSGGTNPGIDLGVPFGIKQTAFPVAVAGDGDRAAVGFIGSPATGDPNAAATFKGIWHAYVAMTYDGGATWTTIDTTPDDPVQVGSICLAGTTCGTDRNLLDFNDMTVDKFGRPLMVYADGCVAPACTTATAAGNPPYNSSRSSKAAIARQSGGRRLFAAYDPVEPAFPGAPRVDSVTRDSSGIVHLSWSAPDNNGSPITGYNVYRRTENGTYGAPLATVTGTTFDIDTSADEATNYLYKVTAINGVGEGTNCGEFPVTGVTAPDPCTAPGIRVISDPSNDASLNPAQAPPADDVQSVSVSEPFSAGLGKLIFTIKVRDLTAVPGGTTWPVEFNAPDGKTYVAQMRTTSGGTAAVNDAVFEYGLKSAATKIPAAAGSNLTADGKITIIVPTSGVGNPQPGQAISGFLTRVLVGVIFADNAPDNFAPTGSYTLVGNNFCRLNTAPVAALVATPTSGSVPLVVNFDASGSSELDSGDTIASYTFTFGDGSDPVTQTSPLISHTYNSEGEFTARVTARDSRNMVSSNVAQTAISVVDPSIRINYALASRGGVATGSTSYSNGGFPAASAINGDRTGGNWGGGTGGWNDGTRDVYPDSLEVSFSGEKRIDEIRLFTLQDQYRSVQEPTPDMTCNVYGILDFEVQYWNGNAWVTVPNGSITNNDRVMRIFSFPEVTTTKIRVWVTNARVHYSRIVELEAIGAGGQ